MSNFKKLFPEYPHTSRVGIREALLEFREKMPELTFSDSGGDLKLLFPEAEDFTLELRGDLNSNLEPVFQGVLTTFCPTENFFTSYYSEPHIAVKALAKHYQRNYVKRPEKSKRKRKDDDAPRGIRKRKG